MGAGGLGTYIVDVGERKRRQGNVVSHRDGGLCLEIRQRLPSPPMARSRSGSRSRSSSSSSSGSVVRAFRDKLGEVATSLVTRCVLERAWNAGSAKSGSGVAQVAVEVAVSVWLVGILAPNC